MGEGGPPGTHAMAFVQVEHQGAIGGGDDAQGLVGLPPVLVGENLLELRQGRVEVEEFIWVVAPAPMHGGIVGGQNVLGCIVKIPERFLGGDGGVPVQVHDLRPVQVEVGGL